VLVLLFEVALAFAGLAAVLALTVLVACVDIAEVEVVESILVGPPDLTVVSVNPPANVKSHIAPYCG
jgi:hypothetical protein